jgi:serine kinase of HPr protein (carbohydrate metabolism regulator)
VSIPREVSAENVHGTSVARDGRAVLLTGPSGSGKSDLALRLIDRGFTLVSDDQTILSRAGDRLTASAPTQIRGKMEIRGLGIVEMETDSDVPLALIVELTSEIERIPAEGRTRRILGHSLPVVRIDAMTASAPAKVALALDRMGLKLQ